MQDNTDLITDIQDVMQDCLEKLEELKEEEITFPFASERVGSDLFIQPALTNLSATRKFTEVNQSKQSDTSDILIHHQEYKVTDARNGKLTVGRICVQVLLQQ